MKIIDAKLSVKIEANTLPKESHSFYNEDTKSMSVTTFQSIFPITETLIRQRKPFTVNVTGSNLTDKPDKNGNDYHYICHMMATWLDSENLINVGCTEHGSDVRDQSYSERFIDTNTAQHYVEEKIRSWMNRIT